VRTKNGAVPANAPRYSDPSGPNHHLNFRAFET